MWLSGRDSSNDGCEPKGTSSMVSFDLDAGSNSHVKREPSGLTSYAAKLRASRLISYQSSCEKMVLRASRTRASKGASSVVCAGRAERPVTLPSFSRVTTSRSDTPPSLPQSSWTAPSSPLRIGARPLFLKSEAAVHHVSKILVANVYGTNLLRSQIEHQECASPWGPLI